MPRFEYKAKRSNGEIIEGIIEAENRRVVIGKIQGMRCFPLKVEEQKEDSVLKSSFSLKLFERIRSGDITVFTRQLSDLLKAGLPLVRALAVIETQTSKEQLQHIVEDIRNSVQGGITFSDALSKHPNVFPEIYWTMVRAGETGGMLETVLERLADFSEDQDEMKSRIISAMAYPAIMLCVGGLAIFVLLTFVIPKFQEMFLDMGQQLPLPTQVLVSMSGGVKTYWWVAVVAVVVAVMTFKRFNKTEEGRRKMDGLRIKLPLFGDLIVKREVARFARTLGTLLKNGVPILQALSIVQSTLSNRLLSDVVEEVQQNIKEGEKLSQKLGESGLFPPIAVNMIAVGEETGALESTLLRLADSYETGAERTIKTLTSMVEPAMILVMAVIVGCIVFAMLLPVFDMSSQLTG